MRRVTGIQFSGEKAYILFVDSRTLILDNLEMPPALAKYVQSNSEKMYTRENLKNSFGWYLGETGMAVPSEFKYSLEKIANDAINLNKEF